MQTPELLTQVEGERVRPFQSTGFPMRISFNLAHAEFFLVKGGKREKSFQQLEPSKIDIPEVSGSEAPVAATWDDNSYRDSVKHVRVFEGRLYETVHQSVFRYDEQPQSIHEVVDEYAAGGLKEADRLPVTGKTWHYLGNNRDSNHASAWRRLESLILIEGVPYSTCEVPKIYLNFDRGTAFLGVTRKRGFHGDRENGGIDSTEMFKLDEMRDAEAAMAGSNHHPFIRVKDIVVMNPMALHYDKPNEMVGRTVGQAIHENKGSFNGWSSDAIRDYLTIRDDYQRWLDDPDDADVVAMLNSAYKLFTNTASYYHADIARFFANYDRLQDVIASMDISLNAITSAR